MLRGIFLPQRFFVFYLGETIGIKLLLIPLILILEFSAQYQSGNPPHLNNLIYNGIVYVIQSECKL
ncbi:MAG: hypothetical protein A4E66_00894 [Syntrophus sp. PtaB.Bin001]|nr:MAG: hypothetical protein A4E66_00894 [Syntrophus sp. PtaB.Bin001]